MPINNEDFSGMFFAKDANGNFVPVGKPVDFSAVHSVCSIELNLSDESAAQLWAIAQGGIEIVER